MKVEAQKKEMLFPMCNARTAVDIMKAYSTMQLFIQDKEEELQYEEFRNMD